MSENLCPKVNMGNEDWDPEVITRMIILGPGARVSESEIVGEFHMLGLPLTIKNTCYGSMISGKKEDVYKATESWEHLSRLQAIDCALWLEGDILLGANAASRESGLKLLLPYADRRMVDLACRIPAEFRIQDDCNKYVLRKAAQNHLPPEVALRPKVGFSVPICTWMREEDRREGIESVLFCDDASQFFSTDQIRCYWDSFLNGNDVLWKILYAIYVFIIWYRDCFLRGLE